jgi:hypothetical protein
MEGGVLDDIRARFAVAASSRARRSSSAGRFLDLPAGVLEEAADYGGRRGGRAFVPLAALELGR